jgi:hypothetical protein
MVWYRVWAKRNLLSFMLKLVTNPLKILYSIQENQPKRKVKRKRYSIGERKVCPTQDEEKFNIII